MSCFVNNAKISKTLKSISIKSAVLNIPISKSYNKLNNGYSSKIYVKSKAIQKTLKL